MTDPETTDTASALPVARALDGAGLIDYADGSVVSRTLVEGAAGTITLFAFDAGQGLSEHTAPFDAIVHVLDGEVSLSIGGETVHASTGQIVRMPAHVSHAVHAPRRFKMLLTMLRSG